jgi:hypothetical protein
MKRTTLIAAAFLLLSSAIYAQDDNKYRSDNSDEFRTLLGHNRRNGFYGAFTIGYSEIGNRDGVIFGGRMEWITGHSLGVGIGGTGFINENHYEPTLNSDVFLTGGYGGLILEPILMPKYPVHLSFPVLLGAGGISYVTKDDDLARNMIRDSETFLIVEPGAEIELNLTKNFRLSIGTSYRLTTPFDVGTNGVQAVSSKSIRAFSYLITFKVGRF